MQNLDDIIKQIIEVADALPNPSILEKKFTYDHINYNQENGLGYTPNNSNINYMGFTIITTPFQFLQLIPKRPWDEDVEYLANAIRDGKEIATPFVSVDTSSTYTEVAAHEGRGRAMAIGKIRGRDTPIIAQIFVRGIRARNITTEMIRTMRKAMWSQNSRVVITDNFWPMVCLQKKWIDVEDEVEDAE